MLKAAKAALGAITAAYPRSSTLLAVMLGLLAGVGGFTFLYAESLSYMSSDAKVCANCHIMNPQYDAWQKASHHNVAVCIDCHLPHPFIRKYLAKAETGLHDAVAFTLQNFHEPIMMSPKGAAILQEACVSCHASLVHEQIARAADGTGEVQCVHCHRNVGHGPMTGMGRYEPATMKGTTP